MSIPAPRASIAIIVGTIESFPHLTQMSSNPNLEYVTPSDKLGQHRVVIGVVHIHLLQRLRHLPVSVVAFNQVWVATYYQCILSMKSMNVREDKGKVKSINIEYIE